MMLFGVTANGIDDFAAAEDLELDFGVPALELEAVDMDPACPLQPARVTLAEDERQHHRGEENHHGGHFQHQCHERRKCTPESAGHGGRGNSGVCVHLTNCTGSFWWK